MKDPVKISSCIPLFQFGAVEFFMKHNVMSELILVSPLSAMNVFMNVYIKDFMAL